MTGNLHVPVCMRNIKPANAERIASTFTGTGCKRSARQPCVKTPAVFPHSATPVWKE